MNWKTIIGIGITIGLGLLLVFKLKANKEITEGKVYQYDRSEAITDWAEVVQNKNSAWKNAFSILFDPDQLVKLITETHVRINSVLTVVGRSVHQIMSYMQLI